ncbi:MAG: hypothetical protein NT080_04800 [Spirochaetes bacterium]|nr:hypothetical protein [Spirochaetota bacterium]
MNAILRYGMVGGGAGAFSRDIYKAFAGTLAKTKAGIAPDGVDLDCPGQDAGIAGLRLVAACVESSRKISARIDV